MRTQLLASQWNYVDADQRIGVRATHSDLHVFISCICGSHATVDQLWKIFYAIQECFLDKHTRELYGQSAVIVLIDRADREQCFHCQ